MAEQDRLARIRERWTKGMHAAAQLVQEPFRGFYVRDVAAVEEHIAELEQERDERCRLYLLADQDAHTWRERWSGTFDRTERAEVREARLREAVTWLCEQGGWRLWYYAEPLPPEIADLFDKPHVGEPLRLRAALAGQGADVPDRGQATP